MNDTYFVWNRICNFNMNLVKACDTLLIWTFFTVVFRMSAYNKKMYDSVIQYVTLVCFYSVALFLLYQLNTKKTVKNEVHACLPTLSLSVYSTDRFATRWKLSTGWQDNQLLSSFCFPFHRLLINWFILTHLSEI